MRYEGYITREGEFIDVSGYNGPISNHWEYCFQHNVKEDDLTVNKWWVKLSYAIEQYIFHGRYLSQEQVAKLKELGYDIDEYDINGWE